MAYIPKITVILPEARVRVQDILWEKLSWWLYDLHKENSIDFVQDGLISIPNNLYVYDLDANIYDNSLIAENEVYLKAKIMVSVPLVTSDLICSVGFYIAYSRETRKFLYILFTKDGSNSLNSILPLPYTHTKLTTSRYVVTEFQVKTILNIYLTELRANYVR